MHGQEIIVVPVEQLRTIIDEAIGKRFQAMEAARQSDREEKQPPALITRAEAAELLQVSKGTIDNYIRDGLLTKRKVGTHRVRLERVEVEKLARRV